MDNQSINNHVKYLNHILLGNVIDSWLISMFNTFLPGKNPAIWNSFSKFIAFCWSLPKGPKRTWMKVYKPFELWESTKMTWRYAMNAFYAFWSMIDGNLRHCFGITYSSYSNICICFSPAPWKSNKAKTLQNAKSIRILLQISFINDFNLTNYPKSGSHFFTGSGNITF